MTTLQIILVCVVVAWTVLMLFAVSIQYVSYRPQIPKEDKT